MPDGHKLLPMDFRQLRTFVTVAETGTVSRAAERLHIAQPALSRRIHGLEDALGVKLFERVGRRLALTGEGELLLADCRSVLGAVSSLGERAQQLRRGESGVLRVGATPQTIDGVFSGFLHRYARRRPNVQIRVSEAVGPTLPGLLERGDLHLIVSLLGPLQADSNGLASYPLMPIEFLAASHESQAVGKRGAIEIGQLAAYPLLLLESTFYVRKTFDAACRLAGVTPNIFMESRTPHALLAMAESGHGVAVVPSVLPTHRYRLRLARIAHEGKPLREPLAIFWDKRRKLPAYAMEFCEGLGAYMREVFPISKPAKARKR